MSPNPPTTNEMELSIPWGLISAIRTVSALSGASGLEWLVMLAAFNGGGWAGIRKGEQRKHRMTDDPEISG